jgi:hypothetical protein
MPDVMRRTPMRHLNADDEIKRLEAYIAQMEIQYECDSATMFNRLAAGVLRDTAETSMWMAEWYILNRLRQAVGQEAG